MDPLRLKYKIRGYTPPWEVDSRGGGGSAPRDTQPSRPLWTPEASIHGWPPFINSC